MACPTPINKSPSALFDPSQLVAVVIICSPAATPHLRSTSSTVRWPNKSSIHHIARFRQLETLKYVLLKIGLLPISILETWRLAQHIQNGKKYLQSIPLVEGLQQGTQLLQQAATSNTKKLRTQQWDYKLTWHNKSINFFRINISASQTSSVWTLWKHWCRLLSVDLFSVPTERPSMNLIHSTSHIDQVQCKCLETRFYLSLLTDPILTTLACLNIL